MNYKDFCVLADHIDDGRRTLVNVRARTAFTHSFRNRYTLVDLAKQMGRTHATVIHYMKLDFRKDAEYWRCYQIAQSIINSEEVVDHLDFETLVKERTQMQQRLAEKSTEVVMLQEEVLHLREKLGTLKQMI
jgi:predicted transcriptional regulator